jgi:O-antigen/teichoic acid export membrane protein
MLNTVLTGALGFAFWILAARLYSPERVGVNSALIAVLMTVSTLCQVNLGSVFVRFLPETTRPARLIVLGYAVAGGFALVVATCVALIAPHFAKDLSVLGSNRLIGIIWVVSVALWCVFALQDGALTGLRSARWIPVENTSFGILKIVALVILAAYGATNGMLLAWVLPMAILVIPVNLIIFRRAVPAHTPAHTDGIVNRFGRRRLVRYLGMTSVASSIDQGMLAALPILVVAILGATQNAYFYIAFTIVTTLELLADNIVTALTVEGTFATDRLQALTAAVGRRFLVLLLPATLILIAAAPLALLFFGRTYAAHGTTVLRLLALASIFRGAIWLYMAVCRIQGRGLSLLAVSGATSIGTLVFTIVFAHLWGLNGVGIGWLTSNVLVAIVVVPMLWRFVRRPAAGSAAGAELPSGGVTADGRSNGALVGPSELLGAATPTAGPRPSILEGLADADADDAAPESAPRAPGPGAGLRAVVVHVSRAAATFWGRARWHAVAFAASAVLIAVLVTPVPVQIRFIAAVVFVMFGPGTALLTLVGSRFAETPAVGLVIALGMAITALVSQLIMWSGQFDARTDLVGAAAVVMIVCGATWWRRRRTSDAAGSQDGPQGTAALRADRPVPTSSR